MEKLIMDSFNILTEESNIQTVYSWMDSGDVICEKLRDGTPLKEKEVLLINKLNAMCKRVRVDNTITLYRGTMQEFDPIIAGKQFNAMSPDMSTAKEYGPYLTKIVVSTGSNAFYISAWELINTGVETQEEKEVLIPPGRFILFSKEDGIVTYIYEMR